MAKAPLPAPSAARFVLASLGTDKSLIENIKGLILLKRLKQKLKEKKGNAYIELAVLVICVTMVIVFGIACGGAFVGFFRTNAAAYEVKRMIAIDGKYDAAEQQKVASYLQNSNIRATVTCTASGEIPEDSQFTITLTSSATIGIGGVKTVSISIPASATGRGEVYWKG